MEVAAATTVKPPIGEPVTTVLLESSCRRNPVGTSLSRDRRDPPGPCITGENRDWPVGTVMLPAAVVVAAEPPKNPELLYWMSPLAPPGEPPPPEGASQSAVVGEVAVSTQPVVGTVPPRVTPKSVFALTTPDPENVSAAPVPTVMVAAVFVSVVMSPNSVELDGVTQIAVFTPVAWRIAPALGGLLMVTPVPPRDGSIRPFGFRQTGVPADGTPSVGLTEPSMPSTWSMSVVDGLNIAILVGDTIISPPPLPQPHEISACSRSE